MSTKENSDPPDKTTVNDTPEINQCANQNTLKSDSCTSLDTNENTRPSDNHHEDTSKIESNQEESCKLPTKTPPNTNSNNNNNKKSNENKTKKRGRNFDGPTASTYISNNSITNTLIQNLQSILVEISNNHNSVNSSTIGANTTLPASNVFAPSSALSGNSSTHHFGKQNSPPALPTVQQIINSSTKSVHDCPPWVHLSHRDAAPQLKIDDSLTGKRLSVKGGGNANTNNSSNNNSVNTSGNSAGGNPNNNNSSSTNDRSNSSQSSSNNSSSSSTTSYDNILRGYRMVRASHGISDGTAFFEVFVHAPPSAHDIVCSLPPHVRLGEKLQNQLKEKILYEQEQLQMQPPALKKQKLPTLLLDSPTLNHQTELRTKIYHKRKQMLGGHVRVGWSMRTGELQAPVGYDRWSYGIRDIMASRIHNSQRHDSWAGGEMASFGPGDIIGIAISLRGSTHTETSLSLNHPSTANSTNTTYNKERNSTNPTNSSSNKKRNQNQNPPTNEIRFFKNGSSLGQILVSRNIRSGGAAFSNIQDGTYYPALSVFMGGNLRVNFGPHFVYPIQTSQLPSGMKKLRPMSELCQIPKPPEDVLAWAKKEKERVIPKGKGGSSASSVNAGDVDKIVNLFHELVETDARIRYEAYQNHLRSHIEEIKKARQKRGLSSNIS